MAATVVSSSPLNNTNNGSQSNLDKIESFINDPSYKEILESSANFNTRLCIERRMRLPFIDTQTGVAQNHSSLFMHRRQRMPGLNPGQIYCYPRQRWRKKRRQYLTMSGRAYARHSDLLDGDGDMHSISQIENPALQDTDSKDSALLSGEASKDWLYDEQGLYDEMDTYDEPDQDSDLDYEESYTKRKRGRKATGRGRTDSPNTPGRKRGAGRGRGKKSGPGGHNYEPTPGDPDKPFACELCGARYKTRPGLTYHYGHSHKEGASDENSRDSSAAASPMNVTPSNQAPSGGGTTPPSEAGSSNSSSQTAGGNNNNNQGQVYQDSYVSFLNQAPGTPGRRPARQPGPPSSSHPPPPPSMHPNQPPLVLPQHPGGGAMPPQLPPQQMVAPPNLPPNLPQQPPLPQSMGGSGDDPPMPVLKPEKVLDMSPMMHPHPMQLPLHHHPHPMQEPPPPPPQQQQQQPPHHPMHHHHQQMMPGPSMAPPPPNMMMMMGDRRVPPSPYCDFCLGDSNQNKKTGGMEELVSCHDCGRSGHPTCLQFTDNMKISVKKYRWQCIECKCCSVCGTSDNDDQLLFCDDCDRGYHMYCLTPPLENPPEGSWSCKLCIEQFHHRK